MNREIKFRGKSNHPESFSYGDFVFGSLITRGELAPLINVYDENSSRDVRVDPDTIGQFTGFYDTNGQPIFEGDILKCRIKKFEHIPYVVGYRLGLFEISSNNQNMASSPLKYLLNGDDEGTTLRSWTVIGNIHDNPELLEGGAQ